MKWARNVTPLSALAVLATASSAAALTDCEAGLALVSDEAQVLTLPQAAAFLQLDQEALAAAAGRGEAPGRRLAGEWRFSRAALIAWLAGADDAAECFQTAAPSSYPTLPPVRRPTPDVALRATAGVTLSRAELGAVTGAGLPQTKAAPALVEGWREQAPAAPDLGLPAVEDDGLEDEFGEDPNLGAARDVALRDQRPLLRGGAFSLEAGIFYSRADRDVVIGLPLQFGQLAPVQGQQTQETFTAVLTGRYGIADDFEVVVSLPFQNRSNQTGFPLELPEPFPETVDTAFGDSDLSLRYALLREDVGVPSVIISADSLVSTGGSDTYGLGGSVSLVKSFDPVALFGSVGYLHTFNAASDDPSEARPKDTVNATAGFAFAMNERLSLVTALDATFETWSQTDAFILPAQERFSLRFALTSLLTENSYIEPSVSFLLNGPGSAVTFGLSLPITLR